MKDRTLGAIALGVFALGTVWTLHTVRTADYCPATSAVSVATLLAPCQALEAAAGHAISREEAIREGLLTPDAQSGPSTEPRTRLAAESR